MFSSKILKVTLFSQSKHNIKWDYNFSVPETNLTELSCYSKLVSVMKSY